MTRTPMSSLGIDRSENPAVSGRENMIVPTLWSGDPTRLKRVAVAVVPNAMVTANGNFSSVIEQVRFPLTPVKN
ncbi:hypothetical protein RMSM_04426 [Rhodopirellula maiorica SM1]|uniref:Uncharacterized protein n=1 Tax=Rhodopirellula maiorica SM1 TaxID=1265738 RepID=M5RH31_9BACT|nr:hypothetical protein [Rhodopirellula maiorica]EMI18650.1 hypothetical protein RMSM_04426 [Rhodopirellula maiorica SM1]